MKFKKIVSIISVVSLLFSMNSFSCTPIRALPISADIQEINENKVSKDLMEFINGAENDDLIPVGIMLEDLDHSIIDDMVEDASDYCIDYYKDIESYRNSILIDIIKDTEIRYGFEKAHIISTRNEENDSIEYIIDNYFDVNTIRSQLLMDMDYEKRKDIILANISYKDLNQLSNENMGMSLISKRVSDDIDGYLSIRRKCVREAYNEYNKSIISSYLRPEQIISNFSFAPYIIAEVSLNDIGELINNKKILEIEYMPNKENSNSMDNALNAVNVTNEIDGSFTSQYTGYGVKVGVMESASGRYDATNSMLSNCENLQFIDNGLNHNVVTASHATKVTSIIKGKIVDSGNRVYRGVAPDCILYQTTCNSYYEYDAVINLLADNGVSIINYSAGLDTGAGYTHHDWLIDCLINNYGIVFVVAAGNIDSNSNYSINVKSPGKAYNAITVGNLMCNLSAPYSISDSSAYYESNMSNKPEICAPGTNLSFPNTNSASSGTSYSAPIVAGIAAQILQYDSTLKLSSSSANGATYFSAVKSLLLLGANPNAVSAYNNISVSPNSNTNLIRQKTGAGIVDAKKTIEIMRGMNNYRLNLLKNINLNSNGTSVGGISIYRTFSQGDKLRAVLTFSKIYESENSDLDLIIYDSNMNQLAYSTSLYNNYEIVEYEIPESGNYYICTNVYNNAVHNGNLMQGALAVSVYNSEGFE